MVREILLVSTMASACAASLVLACTALLLAGSQASFPHAASAPPRLAVEVVGDVDSVMRESLQSSVGSMLVGAFQGVQADAGEAGFMVHSGCSVYDEHLGLCMEAGEGDM
ncbi:unnamed protein product, partial [Symbiodinium sp. KB8]